MRMLVDYEKNLFSEGYRLKDREITYCEGTLFNVLDYIEERLFEQCQRKFIFFRYSKNFDKEMKKIAKRIIRPLARRHNLEVFLDDLFVF